MKINAKENVLLMNKNVRKMGAEPTTTPETTVSNPENTMKVMDMMSQQNIAFQGGMTKLGSKMAKGAVAVAAAAMLAASCTKETNISVVANYDMEAIAAVMQSYAEQISALTVIISNMRTENAAANATQIELLRQMIAIQQQQLDKLNQMSDEDKAFYSKTEQFYKDIINNMVTQEMFLNYLGEDSPLFKAIMAVIEKMNDGQLSAKEAYDQIIKLLTNIDANVQAILTEAKKFNSKADTIIENQVEAGKVSKEQYEEYKAWRDKCYEAILAGNMTLEEFKTQALEKFGEIVSEIINNSNLVKLLTEQVEKGFSTVDKNQERLTAIAEKFTDIQAATLEETISNGDKLLSIYQQMLKNGEITQAQFNEMKNFLNNWYDGYIADTENTAEYRKQVLNNFSTVISKITEGNTTLKNFAKTEEKNDAMTNSQLNILIGITNKISNDTGYISSAQYQQLIALMENNNKLDKLIEQGKISQSQRDSIIEALYALEEAQLEGNSNIEKYGKEVLNKMSEVIKTVANGDAAITSKLNAILNSNKSISEKITEATKLLESIDAKIDVLINQNEEIKTALATIINNQVEHNNITKKQGEAFLKAADEIKAEIEAGNVNANNYYTASYQHWFAEDAQHATMIQILVKNGYTQEQALKYLEGLDTKAAKGEEYAKAAFEELMNVLNNINATVDAIYAKLTEYVNNFNKFVSDYNKNAAEIKQLVKDVRNGVKDISVDVNNIRQKIGSSLSGVEAQLKNIAALIVQADANNVKTMTEGKEEIIAVLETLGYNQTEILQMTMEEVKAAIEKNGTYIQNNGAVLSKILSYVSVLPELKDQGKITNTKLDLIYNKLSNIKVDVEISPEVLAELEALLDQYFEEIAEILNDIDNNITKQGEDITEELKKINANVTVIKGDVATIKDDSAIQKAYLQYILAAVQNIDGTTTNIEEIANQIGVDVAWIRAHGGGGSGSTVDLSKIENYLKQILAEQEATNVKLDLLLALQSKDSDKIDEMLKYIKSIDSTTKSILDEEKNFKDIVITAFASFGIQMDENNEWLEKIYNKKCNCAKDVTIIVEKIYKYLVDGNEGIVDYDKLFDDLFGDDAIAMASTPKTNSVDIDKLIMADETMRLANTMNKATTGRPLNNGVYTMGNIAYTVSGDLDKTMSVADFYKLAAEKMNQA